MNEMSSLSQRSRVRRERGFTLVELVAVVVIMGVLATIAIYSVRKYIQHAKAAEAAEIVGAIKAGEEAYFDETFRYLAIPESNNPDIFYPEQPSTASGKYKIQWGLADGPGGCNACGTRFKALGVMPSAPVLFRYSVYMGGASTDPKEGLAEKVGTPGPFDGVSSATEPFYVVNAVSDLNGDGGKMSAVVGSNLMGDLFSSNIGE